MLPKGVKKRSDCRASALSVLERPGRETCSDTSIWVYLCQGTLKRFSGIGCFAKTKWFRAEIRDLAWGWKGMEPRVIITTAGRPYFIHVYQFRVALQRIKPPIWRRIQVPENYTFWDLHVAIQDALGWWDYHLHEFTMKNPSTGERVRIGIPSDEILWDWDIPVMPGWTHKIAAYFTMENPRASYVYDFGDDWLHEVRLERILPTEEGVEYPRCIKGKRACPPEDCGSIPGYMSICLGEGDSREYYPDFDPERFDKDEIEFDDPQVRWIARFADR